MFIKIGMKMEHVYEIVARLLVKEWLGTLTTEERTALESWSASSVRHRLLRERVTSREFLEEKLGEEERADRVAAWLAVEARLAFRRRSRVRRRVAGVAAVLALAVGAVFMAKESGDRVGGAAIAPGEIRAELTLASGAVFQLDSEARVSEVLAIAAGDGEEEGEERVHALRTPRGGEYSVALSDGTMVWLNAESLLVFPERFAGGERRVKFSGEAYFEVVRDASSPFRVEVNGAVVEVLGTSFNVRAYEGEGEMETTLTRGAVMVLAGGGSVVLAEGEQALVDGAGRLRKREVDAELRAAWKEGYFAFDRDRLERVMRDLARWYKVEVVFESPELKEISFTGAVKRYGDFDTIVRMLEMTGDTRFVISGNTIRIGK
jgi:ferric-dicitrate binding protein FerR (iron transport regulator)